MQREELEQLQRYKRLLADAYERAGGDKASLTRRTVAAVLNEADRQPRGEYRGLTVYSWATSAIKPSLSDATLQAWCMTAARRIDASPLPANELHAHDGQRITEVVWLAMALSVCGHRDFAHRAVIEPLLSAQQPHGPFLKASKNDNLESLWYHELVLLHAVASVGVARPGDETMRKAVVRAADYHLNETQPDHATNDPWALFAFLWNPQSRPLADAMLHAAATMGTAGDRAVTLMLLADALYCVHQLLTTMTNQEGP